MTRAEAIAAADLAEKAFDAAALAFFCARRRFERSRSQRNLRAYHEAGEVLDAETLRFSLARDEIGKAERREHRAAMKAARAALEAQQPRLFA